MVKQESSTLPEPVEDILASAEPVELDDSDRMGGTSGISTQFYSIAQKIGKKAAYAGQFITKNEEGAYETIKAVEVIILESRPRATRFEGESSIACRSYDAVTGTSGELCKDCKYFSFRTNDIEKSLKCKNSVLLLLVDAEDWHSEPFFLQLSPGGIRDWKAYAAEIQNRYKRPVFSVVTKITTEYRKATLGGSYVPVFTAIKGMSAGDTACLRDRRIVESYRFNPPAESAGVGGTLAPTHIDDEFEVGESDLVEEGPVGLVETIQAKREEATRTIKTMDDKIAELESAAAQKGLNPTGFMNLVKTTVGTKRWTEGGWAVMTPDDWEKVESILANK